MKTKSEIIESLLAQKSYLPTSGLYRALATALTALSRVNLANLELLVAIKVENYLDAQRESDSQDLAEVQEKLSRSEREVRDLRAQLKAANATKITDGWKNEEYVAVPIPREMEVSALEFVSNRVSELVGEGTVIREEEGGYTEGGTTYFEIIITGKWGDTLPPFDAYLARYSYHEVRGTEVQSIYGLKRIPKEKAPTKAPTSEYVGRGCLHDEYGLCSVVEVREPPTSAKGVGRDTLIEDENGARHWVDLGDLEFTPNEDDNLPPYGDEEPTEVEGSKPSRGPRYYLVTLSHPNYPKLHGKELRVRVSDAPTANDPSPSLVYCDNGELGCSRNYDVSGINAIGYSGDKEALRLFVAEHGATLVSIKEVSSGLSLRLP